jgi:bla regulator protein blaR1
MMLTPFANHLWESTILALLAGVLTLILRRQPARVRYAVWLVASVKFLIPFSWLVFAGSRLAWFRGPASGTSGLYIAIEVLSKFTPSAIASGLSRVTPVLVGLWLCGILAVFAAWGRQWRRMSAAMRAATPLREGREVEALRRMELTVGIHRPIELRQSRVSVEPGVLGIVRPVLIWPEGISEHLDGAQLEAIVAHEAQHVRRRDNLASAIHMIVEAIFWFHPLVWWLGARLVKERERACDEGVLELGGERRAYAEGILKVCEFCLTSPLDCMAGVAGGDLKKRMVSIMTEQTLQRVDFGRKLLLGTAGLAVIAGPIVLGTLHATPTRAESSPVVAQESQQAAPDHVSQKDMSGMVVKKVQPVYPEAAKKAGIQGEVKLKATIGKNGDIENLQVMSGPAELVPSAIEAVKQWKYRPYMKNGQAAEVVTDVDVTFTLAK